MTQIYESEKRNLSVVLGGDVMLTRRFSLFREPDFLALVELMRGADVGFGNLETVVRRPDEGTPNISVGTYMTTPPQLLEELKWFGLNLFSSANNHAFDFGESGVLATIRHLEEAGISHAGLGRNLTQARWPGYVETRGGRVGLVAATATFRPWSRAGEARPDAAGRPGVNPFRSKVTYRTDSETIRTLRRAAQELGLSLESHRNRQHFYSEKEIPLEEQDEVEFLGSWFVKGDKPGFDSESDPADVEGILKWLSEARRQADWVILSIHSHEFHHSSMVSAQRRSQLVDPADSVRDLARKAIDAGADLVVGHGSHTALGVEIYEGKPIFYDMGNLIFENESVYEFPVDAYDRFGLGLEATPADFLDERTDRDRKGHPGDPAFWESVVAECRFEEGAVAEISLRAIDLGHRRSRGERGRPVLAGKDVADRVLSRVEGLSEKYGTKLDRAADGRSSSIRLEKTGSKARAAAR